MRCTELTLTPASLAIALAVQWVVSPGGSPRVRATTRAAISGPRGAMREGRVLSRSRPSTPSSMNRSCQRHTADAGRAHDLGCARPVGGQKHDPGAPDVLLRAVPIRHDRVQADAGGGAYVYGDACSHPPDSHRLKPAGIPIRTQPSDFDH